VKVFMNDFYKHISGLMLCAMLATAAPLYSVENEVSIVDLEQQVEINQNSSVVWYKQRSVQIAAVAITTAAAIYAFAVYKGKLLSPAALWAGLFCSHVAKIIAAQPQEDNGSVKQNNSPVIVTINNNGENNTQGNTVDPQATQQNETQDNNLQDNYLNEQQNNKNIVVDNGITENANSSLEVNQQTDDNEQNSQNTEIKNIEQKDVVLTGDTVVKPETDVVVKAKSFFVQLKKGFRQWMMSDEI